MARALTPSEFNHLMMEKVKAVDPENKTYSFSAFGMFDTHIIFKNNFHIRFIEDSDGSSSIYIYYPEYKNYVKLSATDKKELLERIKNVNYELCEDATYNFFWIQEVDADETANKVLGAGHIDSRTPIKLF